MPTLFAVPSLFKRQLSAAIRKMHHRVTGARSVVSMGKGIDRKDAYKHASGYSMYDQV